MSEAHSTNVLDKAASTESSFLRLLASGWIFVLLLGLVAIFAALRPVQFASAYNLQQLAINAAIFLVLAVGQTYVIVAAGIDLSCGAVLVFSSVVSAQVMLALAGASGTTFGTTDAGWPVILVGTLVAVGSGAIWGALNGALIAWAKMPALIVTLGSMGMALGLAQIASGGIDVRAMPEKLVDAIGAGSVGGMPSLVLIAASLAVVFGVILHMTGFGLHVFAVGSNAEAARRSGINVRRNLIAVYAISGLMSGAAAVMANARFSTTTINGHTLDNMTAISAVVLGGTSLFGGAGSMFGTVIGVFIPIVLLNGFVILGIPPFWQTVAMGAVLILAVWIDQLKRRLRKSR